MKCPKDTRHCIKNNFDSSGLLESYTEICIGPGEDCPCGTNNVRCRHDDHSYCAPSIDRNTRGPYQCPVNCDSTQKACYVPVFDSRGEFQRNVEYCEKDDGTPCDCSRGNNAKL